MNLDAYENWFKQNAQSIQNDYFQFLRFKSISSEPQFKDEVRHCAEWLAAYIKGLGLNVEVWETEGHPVIFASLMTELEGAPTLLIYHHYDVQPVDPLELWHSDPFEPTVRGGRVYARGAADNKGQCFYSISAIKAWMALSQKRAFNLKIIIEGEEEIGSKNLPALLQAKRDLLQADHLLIVDVDMPAEDVPGITLGMRGIVTFDITCIGANGDLHSGNHGGLAYNPNKALVQLFSKMWNEDGSIAIDGLYDDLDILDKKDLKSLYLDFDEEEYQKKFGVRALDVESEFSPIESNWLRPILEINGMTGGYTGEGFKTIIPSKASAKLSCRLPPHLDPDKVSALIKEFLQKNIPKGMELKIDAHGGGAGFRTSPNCEIALIAARAFESVFKKSCRMVLTGGSIPIALALVETTQSEMVFIGTGLMEDGIHSPNESFAEKNFREGFLVMTQIFEQF